MLSYLVMIGACAMILVLLVRRRRQRPSTSDPVPGRGVAGEAATAMEDLARQLIGTRRPLDGKSTENPAPGSGFPHRPD